MQFKTSALHLKLVSMADIKNVVIVESPAKAKTIEKYLGSGYVVKSSFGHVRDLPKKGLGVDKENSFEPSYEVSEDKKKVISDLKKSTRGATVWLASDEDREGEAIAWHLSQALELNPSTTKRIVFHEITKPAILAAIENPRTIDVQLVDAQQARRVLDRLVGYELSPVLWKKIQRGLSAGRVQSVAVRLIVEREREIQKFEAKDNYKVTAEFLLAKQSFKAELDDRFSTEDEARQFLSDSIGAKYKVRSIQKRPASRSPSAPFTTSTLQQESARRLGYSVRQTMTLAQRLYENGHITYMRTDSTILSQTAISAAEDYIKKSFGANYANPRQYATKNASAQEAHEAIRPSNIKVQSAGSDPQQQKLYQLIWQRTIASQMASASIDKTEVEIEVSTRPELFFARGEVLVFDGYFKVYGGNKDDVILPDIKQNDELQLTQLLAGQIFSKPPSRFSEASLVKKLEDMGIGRPSTYAPTISVIQDRGYIEKADLEGTVREVKQLELKGKDIATTTQEEKYGFDRAKLLPTHLAEIVTDFLVKHFTEIVDYDFTAKAEAELDDIADGKLKWQDMIRDFYKDFEPLLDKSENISRSETSKARTLGEDPKSSKPITARYGRYGPMLQIGEATDDEKPRFAPLPTGTTIESVTLEQALEMFKLPREVGKATDGQIITANIGRYGPYVQVGKLFVNIKNYDPLIIDESTANKLIVEKLKEQANKIIQDFGEIKIIRGPYGPYITDGTKNARISKDTDPEKLSAKEAKELLQKTPARKRIPKRKAKKS